jgi:hypothetical protein
MRAKEVYLCHECQKNIEVGDDFIRFKAFGVVSYYHKKCFKETQKKLS